MVDNKNSASAEPQEPVPYVEQNVAIKIEHDIKASLAVANGFNQALELSFAELCDSYQKIWDVHTDMLTTEEIALLAEQQSDCWHCLSQVQRSIERLRVRLTTGLLPEPEASHRSVHDS